MSGEESSPDFAWCPVRWNDEDGLGGHECANHRPGHETHTCCCGAVLPDTAA